MSLKKYEYKIIDPGLWKGRNLAEAEAYLNLLGHEGWEVVGLTSSGVTDDLGVLCLARRKIKRIKKTRHSSDER
jgi:hypothetical protein